MWLIVGAAWFFFLRGTPLAERMARSGSSLLSLVRYVSPLLFVVLVLIGTMLVTRDMGPLLIAGYGAGAFVAASIAMWWHQRHRATAPAFAIAVALFVAWILATTLALFELGLDRRRHRGQARKSRRADGFGERSARAGDVVPERGAADGLRARQRSVVRLRERQRLRRRAGADPERLHVHGAGGRVRLDVRVGDDARLRRLAAPARPPPRPRDARRAALRRRAGPRRQRRSGVPELARRRVGRARALPARGDRRRQSRRAPAHRRHVSVRELRHDVARSSTWRSSRSACTSTFRGRPRMR